MKKLLLCTLAFASANVMWGQALRKAPANFNGKTMKVNDVFIHDNIATSKKADFKDFVDNGEKAVGERNLGTTTYDLQTNRTVQDRIVMDTSGKILVAWTASESSDNSFPDRGTGYSQYNPTSDSWILASEYPRIESNRCGWPTIMFDGNGGEVLVSHSTASDELKINTRSTAGAGTWTEKPLVLQKKLTWNRSAMGGMDGNTLHIIAATDTLDANDYGGMIRQLVYYRSLDAGQTFDTIDKTFPGLDTTKMDLVSPDAYAIAANGNHVAIGVFGIYNDVILLESFDNGATWTNTIAYDFPFKNGTEMEESMPDGTMIESPWGSGAVIIDENDVAHLTWTRNMIVNETQGDGLIATLYVVDSMRTYSNTSPSHLGFCATVNAGVSPDSAYDGGSFGEYAGTTPTLTQPNMAAGNDSIYVVYKMYSPDVKFSIDNTTHMSHIYLVKSGDDGVTWTDPVDLTPATGNTSLRENAYPDLLPTVDDRIRLIYQRDPFPSVYVPTIQGLPAAGARETRQTNVSNNDIIYLEISLGGQGIGIEKVLNDLGESSVYPNPTRGMATLNVVLFKDIAANVYVTNLQGQVVHTYNGPLSKGTNKVEMDLNHLESGVYTINVTGGGGILTERLVIE